MSRFLSFIVLVLALLVFDQGPASAEEWPPLEHFVDGVELAVVANAVDVSDGEVTLELGEVLRGDVTRLERGEPWTVTRYQHGLDVTEGQQVILCYSAHNQPTPGRYARHNTAFPITDDDTVIYASTGEPQIVELDALLDELRAEPTDDD